MKRQLLAWISIIVFFISTNGIVIYKHICLSSNTNSISLNQLLCEEEDEEDCCSSTNNHDNCCDVDFKFEKYSPNGKTELKDLAYSNAWESSPILPFEFIKSTSEQYFEVLNVFSNPPNPNLNHPKTVSERLADIQAYLC